MTQSAAERSDSQSLTSGISKGNRAKTWSVYSVAFYSSYSSARMSPAGPVSVLTVICSRYQSRLPRRIPPFLVSSCCRHQADPVSFVAQPSFQNCATRSASTGGCSRVGPHSRSAVAIANSKTSPTAFVGSWPTLGTPCCPQVVVRCLLSLLTNCSAEHT